MRDCMGLLESKSIARGVEAADAMAKQAPVELLWTRVVEPGRFLALVSGEVDDVRHALDRGRAALQGDLLDELFLPAAHPSIFDALAGARPRSAEELAALAGGALGLIECATVAATLLAADAAAKQARVRLAALRIGPDMAGKGLVALAGDVADVESSVSKGASLAEERGGLFRTAVIPRPVEFLFERIVW
jgi:microcompartment protein CcmL/EutN